MGNLASRYQTASQPPQVKKADVQSPPTAAKKPDKVETRGRKPSGNAKDIVTLRISKDRIAYYKEEFGENWRTQMQWVIEHMSR